MFNQPITQQTNELANPLSRQENTLNVNHLIVRLEPLSITFITAAVCPFVQSAKLQKEQPRGYDGLKEFAPHISSVADYTTIQGNETYKIFSHRIIILPFGLTLLAFGLCVDVVASFRMLLCIIVRRQ